MKLYCILNEILRRKINFFDRTSESKVYRVIPDECHLSGHTLAAVSTHMHACISHPWPRLSMIMIRHLGSCQSLRLHFIIFRSKLTETKNPLKVVKGQPLFQVWMNISSTHHLPRVEVKIKVTHAFPCLCVSHSILLNLWMPHRGLCNLLKFQTCRCT